MGADCQPQHTWLTRSLGCSVLLLRRRLRRAGRLDRSQRRAPLLLHRRLRLRSGRGRLPAPEPAGHPAPLRALCRCGAGRCVLLHHRSEAAGPAVRLHPIPGSAATSARVGGVKRVSELITRAPLPPPACLAQHTPARGRPPEGPPASRPVVPARKARHVQVSTSFWFTMWMARLQSGLGRESSVWRLAVLNTHAGEVANYSALHANRKAV